MYVCLCTGITDRDIEHAASEGCRDVHELAARTGAGAGCGCCRELAGELLERAHARSALALPVLPAAA